MNFTGMRSWLSLSSFLLSWACLGALGACSFSLVESNGDRVQQNECQDDVDCAVGFCSQNICQTSTSPIETLLFEVTPPAGTEKIAGIRFTQVARDWGKTNSGVDIQLNHVSRVRGLITADEIPARSCVPHAEPSGVRGEEGSLPARVTFIPRERLLGLAHPIYSTEAQWDGKSHQFSIVLAPGDYDIYVEPLAAVGDCVQPPHLLVAQSIVAGDVELQVGLPPPEVLSVKIRWPDPRASLSGWTLDIVERDAGRLLSNREVIQKESQQIKEGVEYAVQVAFSAVHGDLQEPATEIVRLSPPADWVAPTVFIERSVVELFQEGQGVIDQLKELPQVVRLGGRISQVGSVQPVPSQVTLTLTELLNVGTGTVTAFSRVIETDEQGIFEVDVLPGKYRVRAEPLDSAWAQAEVQLTVSEEESTQAGRTIEVAPRRFIQGQLFSQQGQALSGAAVQALGRSSGTSPSLLALARGLAPSRPRADGSMTDSSGRFSLRVDSGTFDLVFQPEGGQGYSWGLWPYLNVQEDKVELGAVQLAPPLALEGRLISQDIGAVPLALIRAYAFMKDGELTSDVSDATTLIPVGEARVDSQGRYRLLLPSRFK